MKKTITLMLLAGYMGPINAQHASLEWVNHVADGKAGVPDFGFDVAIDDAENVYIAGTFADSAHLIPGLPRVATKGGQDGFLTKYDAGGKHLWTVTMGGLSTDHATAVAADGAGSVYVAGYFNTMAVFDGDTVRIAGGTGVNVYDAFLARYDTSGKLIWVRTIGGTLYDVAESLSIDSSGNVYVCGYFSGTAHFNNGGTIPPGTPRALTSRMNSNNTNPSIDGYVAKYNSGGNCLWAKHMGGKGSDGTYSITVSKSGSVYVAGSFEDTADFNIGGANPVTLISSGGGDIFIAKYDANGDCLWAKGMGGKQYEGEAGIAVDDADNIYITGCFSSDTAYFNPGSASSGVLYLLGGGGASGFRRDILIAKYNSKGDYIWAKSIGGATVNAGQGIALDAAGNVCITGFFAGPWINFFPPSLPGGGAIDFDPGPDTAMLYSAGGADIFVAKYSAGGNYIWAKNMGGAGAGNFLTNLQPTDQGRAIAINTHGDIYVAGLFSDTCDFDPGQGVRSLISAGAWDAFLLKLRCNDTSSFYLDVSEECGKAYTLNGQVYTTSGIYTQRLPNAAACDSTITLELTFTEIKPDIAVDGYVLRVVGTYTTYQWIKNGTDITGATHPAYSVTENADYQVRVTNMYGCQGTSGIYKVSNVGLENVNSLHPQISIWPNPAQDIVHIRSPFAIRATLYDMEGRAVLQINDARSIPVTDLASGMYILRIAGPDNEIIKTHYKIIKQ